MLYKIADKLDIAIIAIEKRKETVSIRSSDRRKGRTCLNRRDRRMFNLALFLSNAALFL
ncbi:hypothetical protein MCHI_002687 [Candidatus Magnetoovum chiemensis]|nr:hypothetical protein MCHI_002687 [Candidatus Magnetoovum chiemensis]